MNVLLKQQVQWDITVAIVERDGALLATPYLGDPSPSFQRLNSVAQIVCSDPLVVGGVLPADVVGVVSLVDTWQDVEARDGVWLGRVAGNATVNPFDDLRFVLADGTRKPFVELPDELRAALNEPRQIAHGTSAADPPPALNEEGRRFASTVAAAIVDDIAQHGPSSALQRVVVRWFWSGDPAYLTIHALGVGDAQPAAEDAWHPLEWPNEPREIERTDRILGRDDVQRAAEALRASFPTSDDGGPADDAHLSAVTEIVSLLPAALQQAGVPLAARFAVSAAHFEGWGARDILQETASDELLAALAQHSELPEE